MNIPGIVMTLNGRPVACGSASDLATALREIGQSINAEIWLDAPSGSTLAALMNPDGGFLLFRAAGDEDWVHCLNQDRSHFVGETDFRLANGQVDSYPRAWTFDRTVLIEAIRGFVETAGGKSDLVGWSST